MNRNREAATNVRWYFYRQPSGAWCWDAVAENGTVVAQSSGGFDTRPKSVEDARAHGYGGVTSHGVAR